VLLVNSALNSFGLIIFVVDNTQDFGHGGDRARAYASCRVLAPREALENWPRASIERLPLFEMVLTKRLLHKRRHSALGLKSRSQMTWGRGNFLVSSRYRFVDHGSVVAVIDAPSGLQEGMNPIFRMSRARAGDIDSVAFYLKDQAAIPVWLVGTSRGTFSAVGGGDHLQEHRWPDLSTVTRSRRDWEIARTHPDGAASMALHNIVVPTLVMSHRSDACDATPATEAEKLRSLLIKARGRMSLCSTAAARHSRSRLMRCHQAAFRHLRGRGQNHS